MSIVAHSAAIAIAVAATAHARMEERTPREVVRWIEPPSARTPSPAPKTQRKPSPPSTSTPALPAITIDRIDMAIPPIDLTPRAPSHDVIPSGGGEASPGVKTDSAGGRESTAPFSAEQVERQVSLRNGGRAPRYPNVLRASGIEGEVVAHFVVSEAGRVEPTSVRFVRSDHVLFEAAVREALDGMRFNAAEVGGKRVRQLVQMPFVFTLTR